MNIMDPNRGGSGGPSSLLLWALLGMVIGLYCMAYHLGFFSFFNFSN